MKKLYSIILFFILTFLVSAQSNDGKTSTNITARPIATTTSPTDPSNTEVGVTDGALNVSLTGGASYTIPILVPPGINGVEPSISINYNSQRGLSGTAAKGWDIGGISSITRIPATKFHDGKIDPVDFNSLDRFALDGQRLIVKNGSSAAYGADKTEYETEYFSNTKITSYGVHPSGAKYGPAYFLVEYPNGTQAYYGNSTDSRSVMEWSITNVDNPQGIRITYTYTTASNSLYINSIKYGGLTSTTPINEIKFGYGPRSSFNDSYVGGINVNRDKNLVSINVIGNGVGFRNYFPLYAIQDMITSIIEKNGDNTKSYNPTIFDYGRDDGSDGIDYTQGNNKLDVGSIRSTDYSTISGDFDADGNMDFILYPTTGASAKAKYWLYTDTNPSVPFSFSIPHDVGFFEEIFPVTYLNAVNKLGAAQGWAVAKKTNTDYTFNVYSYNTGLSNINPEYSKIVNFPLDIVDEICNSNCTLNNQVFRIFPKKIISGDFNGDGVTDVIAIDTRTLRKYCNENISTGRCTASNENVTSTKVYFVDLKRDNTTNFLFYAGNLSSELTATAKVEVGDFNGDGKSDIFIFDLNYVKIYGLSDANQLVLLYQNTIADASIVLDKPILMGDYNGDGKTDFMIPRLFGSVNWYKYTSTGNSNSLLKEEIITGLIFSPNDSYNTYNYIPVDFNNDNKTDILVTRSKRNSADTLGLIAIDSYQNVNGSFPVTTGIARSGTQEQADINIYALPVYLPVHQQNLKNGTIGSTLQVAFLNENKIHFFTSASDLLQRYLLTNIRTGNGVEEAITYIPLSKVYRNTYNNIYTPSTSIATYPNFDIQIDPNLYVVSKIEHKSTDVYKKRWFGYYGAVSNFEGLGFMGFRSVTQTNWHDDTTKVFTDIYKNNIDLRGATIETASVPYLSYPYPGALPSDFTTKSVTAYNDILDPPLQPNKVFILKTTNVKTSNTLNNTNTEVKDIVYDTNNNITSSTTLSNDGPSTLAKSSKTEITYENPKTTPLYILGRPSTIIQTVTADGHTMTISEKYTYNTKELLDTKEKFAIGTSTIKEAYEYDSYGNITKNTITPTLPMLPRSTKYEYDITKRFVSKITDIDNLETSFVYNPNGLLKKVTDPYLRSKSYDYDSWFKNTTITDDQLNNVFTNTYTRSTEKTIVTTIASAPSLDSSAKEDTFDDSGRKIKSGTKDLNGNYSYVSYLYDIYDRNIKVSEPYTGATPTKWNEVKFDDYGRNTQTNLFNGRSTSTSYTPTSLKANFTDGLKTKTTTQNAAGNTVSTNESTGGDILYNYFGNGSLRKTKYNGVEIEIEQDGWGNKTALKDPSAGTYRYSYNDLSELLTETIDGTGITTTVTRDPNNGKPTKKTIVDAKTNIEINYTYDGDLPLTTTYTDFNEPLASRKTTTTITYDTSKRISTIVEEKGTAITKFTTTYTYDAYDRIVTETKEAKIGATAISTVKTKKSYKNGNLYQISDFATGTVLWQYNTLNAKGQVLESQTGNGIKITNTYDPTDGSLSKIQYDKTTAPVGNILTLTTVFDKNTDYLSSRINSAFGNYTETFFYDDIGRLKEFTNRLGKQETQTYDASGKITGNNLGTYGYDTTKPYQNTSVTLNPEATGYYADREGIFSDSMEDKMGWGATKSPSTNFFSYDVLKTPNAKGKTTLKLANTTTTEQYLYSDKWISIDNAVPTQYTYSAWAYSDSPQAQIFLIMKDAAGNITTDNIVSNIANTWTPITKTFLVPANIKKISIRLDNNGLGNIWYDDVEIRKTSDPTSTVRQLIVSYNAFKGPIQIEETNVDKISFLYNGNNQRSVMYYGGFQIDKSQRPLRKYYSADGSMEVKENTLTNTFEFVTYIGGDGYSAPIIAKSDGINTPNYLYLHRDYQGTILAVTDANGALVEKRLFDAWGSIIKVQDGAGNTLAGLIVLDRGYTGHEHLQSVGLINMNARLYDPMLHRFLQTDNYIQDPSSTQNYNQYGYVLNNPLLYTDPSGNVTSQGPGDDCAYCSGYGSAAASGLNLLKQNWDSWGIKDWAKKNFNGDNFSKTWKKKVSFNNMFGGGGNKNSAPPPPPNMSKYVNLNSGNFSSITGALPNQGGGFNNRAFTYASGFAIALAADDVTGVGVADDVLIPVVYGVASGQWLYDNRILIAKQAYEINKILAKKMKPTGFTYELRVNKPGEYIDVRGNKVLLKTGDLWKYGESSAANRYSQKELDNMVPGGVFMDVIFFGNQVETKVQEKIMIYGHALMYGSLPPGNRIFR